MNNLRNFSFLADVKHFFLNCKSTLRAVAADPASCATIRRFVFDGGTLYASDWSSDVVSAAFAELVRFTPRAGKIGVVPAKVSDPYLAKRLTGPIHLNFDLDAWVRISHFPPAADVYITDEEHRPLAVGFRAGKGRVVFTSFHHHAQLAGPRPSDEDAILEWLVTLPVQHRLTLVTRQVQARHRATVQNQVVGRMTGSRQVIPMNMPTGSGLGVFSLSWDRDDQVELSMRYLRDREVPVSEERSATPPLVMTIRNPGRRDSVEIGRHAVGGDDVVSDEPMPFAFTAGMRRDLLEDPDWLASAILRHIFGIIGQKPTLGAAKEVLTANRIIEIVNLILSGLGYRTRSIREETPQPTGLIRAWPMTASDDEIPALDAQVVLTREVRGRSSYGQESFPLGGAIHPGIERLLVSVSFSAGRTDFSWGDSAEDDESPPTIRSSSDEAAWRPVASASAPLGQEGELMSDKEFHENYHVDVRIFRAEPTSVIGENIGDDGDEFLW